MVELKPCPFCGGRAEIQQVGDRQRSTIYQCAYCSCRLETGEEWGHGTDWNTRTEASAAVKVKPEELERYTNRCREMSEGGKYSWWSRLADILSTLSPAPQEAEAVDGEHLLRRALVLITNYGHNDAKLAEAICRFIRTHPPEPAVTEAMVETVGEHLFSMGHTGINKRDLRAALQAAQEVKL